MRQGGQDEKLRSFLFSGLGPISSDGGWALSHSLQTKAILAEEHASVAYGQILITPSIIDFNRTIVFQQTSQRQVISDTATHRQKDQRNSLQNNYNEC
jgi:hypothetical protein